MEQAILLKITLETPTPGVWFALQKGKGNGYLVEQLQTADGQNLIFSCPANIKFAEGKPPVFLGSHVHGTPDARFIYIDIGKCAGQLDSPWERRLKIPLVGITQEILQQLLANPQLVLQTKVAGIGRDGGPNCATVKPFNGWWLEKI